MFVVVVDILIVKHKKQNKINIFFYLFLNVFLIDKNIKEREREREMLGQSS